MRFILIICMFIGCGLNAKLEDHFKKAFGKTEYHQMRNIDFIYVINLDQRPEKFEKTVEQLAPWKIKPYRFSAVNGWELPLETITDVGVIFEPWMATGTMGTFYEADVWKKPTHEYVHKIGRTYFCHCMSLGAIGIALSHLSILQDAYDSGYKTIWVMEDDIDVIRDPHILSDLIDRLDATIGKDSWDILFTDPDTKNTNGTYVPAYGYAWRPNFFPANSWRFSKRIYISSEFQSVGARFGAYSMIVRRSGMKKILDFIKEHGIFLPYDIEYPLPNDIRLFTVLTDIVSTLPGAPSDNGSPGYLNKGI